MLTVDVTLHSAITGEKTRIASMVIYNDGTSDNRRRGNYEGKAYRKPFDVYDGMNEHVIRQGKVQFYPRLDKHVWHLVQRMLTDMGYDA